MKSFRHSNRFGGTRESREGMERAPGRLTAAYCVAARAALEIVTRRRTAASKAVSTAISPSGRLHDDRRRGCLRALLLSSFFVCQLAPLAASAQTAELAYPIVDTAQTSYYNYKDPITAPAQPSDAYYGQDARFNGYQPAYRDNGDGTVTDLNTGLMWVKARGSLVTWAAAVAGAANSRVGGYSDWRMPTIKELYSLIEFNGDLGSTDATSVPYIDRNVFDVVFGDINPNESNTVIGNRVIDAQDWSGTEYVSTTMQGSQTAFGVNFIDGRIKGYPIYDPATGQPKTNYVRYVRGNDRYGQNEFVDNGDDTITDRATGLMWAQNDSGVSMDWQAALAWVQAKNAAHYLGYDDWRLPNAKELQSIVDYARSPDTTNSAAIDPLFHATEITNEGGEPDYPWYWTGTTHVEDGLSDEAVYVAFGRALGWMKFGNHTYYTLVDAHGAGAQRSDPKSGSPTAYPLGKDFSGNEVYGRGPQGDVVRVDNFVRLVRDSGTTPSDCLFDWAETTYAQFFPPSGATSTNYPPYYYRYYPATGDYIATSTPDGDVWVLGPATNGQALDVGASSGYMTTAGCSQ